MHSNDENPDIERKTEGTVSFKAAEEACCPAERLGEDVNVSGLRTSSISETKEQMTRL